MTDKEVLALSHLTGLRDLNLNYCINVSSEGLRAVSSLTALTTRREGLQRAQRAPCTPRTPGAARAALGLLGLGQRAIQPTQHARAEVRLRGMDVGWKVACCAAGGSRLDAVGAKY